MSEINSASLGGASSSPSIEMERERMVPLIKEFRQQIDALIQKVPHGYPNPNDGMPLKCRAYAAMTDEAYTQVRIHLTSAKMWAGKMLEGLGNPFPAELADKAKV